MILKKNPPMAEKNKGPGRGYRDPALVRHLKEEIQSLSPNRNLRVMHVCGTHENALCQFGLRDLLPAWLRLVAGPGCPVCVCPASDIDLAVRLTLDHGAILACFGDVVRVPARMTLLETKARGGDCRVIYSPEDAVKIALENPERQVVFFAVGFETTACTTAALLKRGVPGNFSILCAHRLVPPALEALLATEGPVLDGFLLPGHVTTVTGIEPYQVLHEKHGISMAVGGFEPVDILLALKHLLVQISAGKGGVFNAYPRAVRSRGNAAAQQVMAEVFEECEAAWRGIGKIPASGYRIRRPFRDFNAAERFSIAPDPGLPDTHPDCLCGEVLLGRVEPEECALFGSTCQPENPVGPCMVAFEGTCHARFRHRRSI